MTRTRIPALALVVAMVMALATPGFADSLDQRGADARAKKAAAAAKLDALKASDDQIESAVRALDGNVAAQSANSQSAQQSAAVATSQVGSAEAALAATEARMTGLRRRAADMAVRAYIHPGGGNFLEIMRSRDLAEASRRETLLSHVASTGQEVLGQLRSARQDLQARQSDLARLRDQAEARRKAAVARLNELRGAQTAQVRMKAALDGRIQEFVSEVDALAREEANIAGLIRARQAPPAPPPARPSSGGGAGASPRGASATGLIWPASGPVTSGFGMRWGRLHAGIDIAAGSGAPIRAAKSGTVIQAGSYGGYGNATIIDHGGGFTTLYGHQSQILVASGATVTQGQVIGRVGCTGHCTGPHLHFETRVGGSPQNPMNFLP